MGQKQTLHRILEMSALPPGADIEIQSRDVRFVPIADILPCGEQAPYSITSSARSKIEAGTTRPSAFAAARLIVVTYFTGF